jgi:hypothetical protein
MNTSPDLVDPFVLLKRWRTCAINLASSGHGLGDRWSHSVEEVSRLLALEEGSASTHSPNVGSCPKPSQTSREPA